jgi:hypothetical protein
MVASTCRLSILVKWGWRVVGAFAFSLFLFLLLLSRIWDDQDYHLPQFIDLSSRFRLARACLENCSMCLSQINKLDREFAPTNKYGQEESLVLRISHISMYSYARAQLFIYSWCSVCIVLNCRLVTTGNKLVWSLYPVVIGPNCW